MSCAFTNLHVRLNVAIISQFLRLLQIRPTFADVKMMWQTKKLRVCGFVEVGFFIDTKLKLVLSWKILLIENQI